jgi:hypothetical protein
MQASWLAGHMAGQLAGQLDGWLAGWLAGWSAGWLATWRASLLASWLAGWLAGWPAGWLAGWYPVQDDSRRKNSLCNVGCCARTLNCLAIVKRTLVSAPAICPTIRIIPGPPIILRPWRMWSINLLRAIPSWAKSHLENLYVFMKIRKVQTGA